MSIVYSADHGDNYFQPLGKLGSDGIKFKSHAYEHFRWGDGKVIKTTQAEHTVSFECRVDAFSPEGLAIMFGPLFPVAYAFSRIDPHWYLRGDVE